MLINCSEFGLLGIYLVRGHSGCMEMLVAGSKAFCHWTRVLFTNHGITVSSEKQTLKTATVLKTTEQGHFKTGVLFN